MNKHFFWAAILSFTLGLSACGGGGGGDNGGLGVTFSGTTSAATITTDNSDELAVAAASGAKQALSANDSNAPLRPANTDEPNIKNQLDSKLKALIKGFQPSQGLAARTENLSSQICTDSGTAIATGPDSATTSYTVTVEFNHCKSSDYGYGYVFEFHGRATLKYQESGNTFVETLNYNDLTVTYTYNNITETYTLNFTETCSGNLDYSNYSCDTYSDFSGYDSRTYRVEDVSVSGDNSSGYNVYATVYDPDYGHFSITASGVTFCDSGYPGSGTVTFSDGSQSGSIEFLSCTQYQYTYNGTTNGPFNW